MTAGPAPTGAQARDYAVRRLIELCERQSLLVRHQRYFTRAGLCLPGKHLAGPVKEWECARLGRVDGCHTATLLLWFVAHNGASCL